jgi:surfeit locus 1 family protein
MPLSKRMSRASFRPSLVVTVAAIAGVALTVSLGNWQRGRAAEKLERQRLLDERSSAPPIVLGRARVDPDAIEWHKVRIVGELVPERTVLLDNRVHKGAAGFQVLTPMRIDEGAPAVVVNRGWIAAGRTRDARPAPPVPSGRIVVEGIATRWPARVFELREEVPEAPNGQRPAWQNATLERYVKAVALDVQPILVLQTSGADDGLVRDWPAPAAGIDKHRMYMWQWYSFATLIAVLYVALNLRRRRAS